MKLSDIEGIMHGSVGVKLEDLVGKVLKLTFIIHEMEKRGGGHESVYYERERSSPPESMTMVALGHHKKKLLFINKFYIEMDSEKGKEDQPVLVKKGEADRYGGHNEYELTGIEVKN